jgi:aldehyde dehydrogenase (NAD+)
VTSEASAATTQSASPAVEPAVREVAERLRATFGGGRTRSLAWRRRQLSAIERLLDERERELTEALAADLSRPALQAWIGDLASTRKEAAHARKHLRHWMRPRRVGLPLTMRPGRAWYQYEPLGVALVIGPWNYPVYLTLGPVVGAIAAGNCVIVKPSEHAPATSALLAELIPEYLDPDAVAVVEGGASETLALIDQGLDHILFTGGPAVGRAVMQAAAAHLTPVTLELGGKCPAIVTRRTDIAVAARRIAMTKLVNSGQTCIAPDHVLVEEPVADALRDALVKTIKDFTREDDRGLSRPIVNEAHARRLTGLLEGHGGTVVLGGDGAPEGRSVDLTVVVDPDPGSDLMREEIFGPILPVLTVGSLDEAIRFVRDRPKPLAAYLFSPSRDEQRRFLSQLSSGGAVINQIASHCLIAQLPFGGVGNSGMGAYHGKWGFQTFSHRKAVHKATTRLDPKAIYPPYTPRSERLIRRFL